VHALTRLVAFRETSQVLETCEVCFVIHSACSASQSAPPPPRT
jgi:hypothetical protein